MHGHPGRAAEAEMDVIHGVLRFSINGMSGRVTGPKVLCGL